MLQCNTIAAAVCQSPANIGHNDSVWRQHATQNRFLYSIIIISIFLACYHVATKMKKMSFCGGPLFGRTCWTCLNPPLILVMAILLYVPNSCSWLTVRVMCSYFCFIIWLLGLQKYHTLSIKIYSCCITRHGELHWSYTWVRAISSKKRWLINYIFCNVNEDC